jgi:hypothetical protein
MLILCLYKNSLNERGTKTRLGQVHPRTRGSAMVDALSQMMWSFIESDHLRSTLSTEAVRAFGTMDWVAVETERVHSSL